VHPAMARPPILSVALPSDTGRVLSIQSHTVQGYVGNKSAVFPLQLLGFDVDPINSVQFSNHTGYPKFRGQVLNGNQLWDLIEGLEENELLHYTHLLTGYIGSVSFLNTVLQVVNKLRSVNPNLIYGNLFSSPVSIWLVLLYKILWGNYVIEFANACSQTLCSLRPGSRR